MFTIELGAAPRPRVEHRPGGAPHVLADRHPDAGAADDEQRPVGRRRA